MNVINQPIDYYVKLLKENQPFCFARYGDGEWMTILGFYGMLNANGCVMSRELSDDLRAVLKRQNPYYHCILKIAKHAQVLNYNGKEYPYNAEAIDKYLSDNGITIPWYNGDVMLDVSLKGSLFPLIEQIRRKRILYVGSEQLRRLNGRGAGFFDYIDFIQTPPKDAHKVKDELLFSIHKSIVKNRINFIGWSAGLAAKVFIDEVWMKYPWITSVDFGSIFDGFFPPLPHIKAMGRTGSRSYIRNGGFDWGKLRKLNTGS